MSQTLWLKVNLIVTIVTITSFLGCRAPTVDQRVVGQMLKLREDQQQRWQVCAKVALVLLAITAMMVAPFMQELWIFMHSKGVWRKEPYRFASAFKEGVDTIYDVCIVFGVISLMFKHGY
jgi:hypothetical protein